MFLQTPVVQVLTHTVCASNHTAVRVNGSANDEAMAVHGPVNGHLWVWKDDGEFLCQASFAQDRRFAWNDHFLKDSARRHVPGFDQGWRGCDGKGGQPLVLATNECLFNRRLTGIEGLS